MPFDSFDRRPEPTVKEKWIAALRSGEHRQIQNAWNNGQGGMCAAGVLMHVVEPSWKYGTAMSPVDFLISTQPFVTEDLLRAVVYFNDGPGLSFKAIADKLERNDFEIPEIFRRSAQMLSFDELAAIPYPKAIKHGEVIPMGYYGQNSGKSFFAQEYMANFVEPNPCAEMVPKDFYTLPKWDCNPKVLETV